MHKFTTYNIKLFSYQLPSISIFPKTLFLHSSSSTFDFCSSIVSTNSISSSVFVISEWPFSPSYYIKTKEACSLSFKFHKRWWKQMDGGMLKQDSIRQYHGLCHGAYSWWKKFSQDTIIGNLFYPHCNKGAHVKWMFSSTRVKHKEGTRDIHLNRVTSWSSVTFYSISYVC